MLLRTVPKNKVPAKWTQSATKVRRARLLSSTTPRTRQTLGTSGIRQVPAVQFFSKSPVIIAKRNKARTNNEPLLLFLEGPPGTGIPQILSRLNKIGYYCIFRPYVPFIIEKFQKCGYSPNGVLVSHLWNADLLTQLEQTKQLHSQDPKRFKEDIVFVQRSPMTSLIYSVTEHRPYFTDLIYHITKTYNTAFVLCESDMIRIHERIGERNYYAVGNEKVIREQLNEENQQALEEIHDKYKKLKETLFDTSLTTTDTKQAVANILTMCGIEFRLYDISPNKDLEKR